MDDICLYNLKLYNLMEHGHSGRTISRIISHNQGKKIGVNEIYGAIGKTPTADAIINDLEKIREENYFSLYCLLYFDVNIFVVNKVKEIFGSIEALASEINELSTKISLQQNTINKISFAIQELSSELKTDIKKEILSYIKQNEPISNNSLKELMLNKYNYLTVLEYDDYVDQLIQEGKIINAYEGFKSKKQTIQEFFLNSNDSKDLVVEEKCKGATFEKIAKTKELTKQRIQQIIKKQISYYPLFENEVKYKNLLDNYSFNFDEIFLLNLDTLLVEYIFLKYDLKPKKSSLDYINDFNLFNSPLGKKILKNKKLVIIQNELLKLDFLTLFKRFISDKKITSFTLDDIVEEYNNYLTERDIRENSVYIEKSEEDLTVKKRKISHSKNFIEVVGRHFIINNPDALSFDFFDMMKNYLEEFKGYGSVELIFEENEELCKKNNIFSPSDLYALMKSLFSEEFKNRVKFDRNPVIVSTNIDKEKYIESLILDMELPCTVNDYLKYVHSVTGLKEASVLANFNKIINQFKNSEGLISLEDDISGEEKAELEQLLDSDCVGYDYLKDNLEIKYQFSSDKIERLLNVNILKKIGYVKTNTTIYNEKYSNRQEAVIDQINKMDYIVTNTLLYKISNISYFNYRMFDFIDKCYLIKIDTDKYLNLIKREQSEVALKLKKDIFLSLNDNKIYVLDNYINSIEFTNVLNRCEEYKELILSFNPKAMIEYLLMTNRDISCINSLGTVIFSKSELSIKSILDKILCDYKSLSFLELREVLYEDYKMIKEFTNSELSDMGFYCPQSSEKVYLNKDYYEQEVEELLNE